MRRRTVLLLFGVFAGFAAALAAAAPLGTLTEFPLSAGSAPFRLASGADENLWFSDQGTTKAIVRMTTVGVVHPFTLPSTSVPRQVRVGADGNLWFTDTSPAAPAIGRVNADGTIAEFPLRAGSVPNALALVRTAISGSPTGARRRLRSAGSRLTALSRSSRPGSTQARCRTGSRRRAAASTGSPTRARRRRSAAW
jgi:hypothetical protein